MKPFNVVLTFVVLTICLSCGNSEVEEDQGIPLPVVTLQKDSTITTFEYLGAIEGKVNVEIRPQVEGILDSIYVDEGDYVEESQPLFKINAMPYMENLKNAQAAVEVEKARLNNAQIELERLQPLVEHEVISEVQLRTAQSDYEVAKSTLEQMQSLEATSRINVGFTLLKAPVSGYIGRIPKRIGNLVTKGDSEPVTVLSDISEVYVYFAMSESNYLFYKKMSEDTTARRLNPHVKLILADGSEFDQIGVIDADAGQIERSTGSITLRAKFANPDAILRTGNTGKIILEQIHPNVLLVPQQATTVIQDVMFVFVLDEENKAVRKAIKVEGKSGKNYIVSEENLSEGDVIVLNGLDKLTEGTKVNPIPEGQVLANVNKSE
ncbi:MAG TPA: efflux RND transporter periplasmic adaptor subunit [Cyclobacteriaceae bacterium]|nr:efflux RND transporter periplasmic adaptor subunit [Cyclobacteriaceae bacterium]